MQIICKYTQGCALFLRLYRDTVREKISSMTNPKTTTRKESVKIRTVVNKNSELNSESYRTSFRLPLFGGRLIEAGEGNGMRGM